MNQDSLFYNMNIDDKDALEDKSSMRSGNSISFRTMEFIKGFKWAIPQAFSDAISRCQFEEGDIFYDTTKAYDQWAHALNVINYSVQVKSSPEYSITVEGNETIAIFERNWKSKIKIDITNYRDTSSKKSITLSQGKLFTFLRRADFDVLDAEANEPKLPILVDEARKFIVAALSSRNEKETEEASDLLDKTILGHVKNIISSDMEKPNIFIMLYDSTNNTTTTKFKDILSSLKAHFSVNVFEVTPVDCNLPNYDKLFPTIIFKALAINSGKSEMIRDSIKEVLWPKKEQQKATKTVNDILTRDKRHSAGLFKLSRHGIFYSYKDKEHDADKIRTHSFKRNNTFFRYRLAQKKIDQFIRFPKSISTYLNLLFTDCPNHLFMESNFHASGVDTEIDVHVNHKTEHELINIAKASRSYSPFNSRHENLEKYMLENDNNTIACEIPLWIESGELKDYSNVFNTYEPLTGHIDILRMEHDERIGIWDYKPKAFHEKFAKTQVFLYAFMLAVRTGRSLKDFVCGYFDEVDVFYFNPSDVKTFEL